jgi:predicted protein tyrosine phosphatase
MPTIHVCPLHDVADAAATLNPSRLLTLLSIETEPPPTPPALRSEHHLRLTFHDIAAPIDGYTHPTEAHVAEILAFAQAWDRRAPLLIHCWAGISRSTAAAYMTACALYPDRDEHDLARALRTASPTATPNALMIAHADSLLGRGGRMCAAIGAIGRGQSAAHGRPFAFSIDQTA